MNNCFRTAFWTLCFGLTVPMMLFVGAELSTPAESRVDQSAQAGTLAALRDQWSESPSISGRSGNRTRRIGKSDTGKGTIARNGKASTRKARTALHNETPRVELVPELSSIEESDDAMEFEIAGSGTRTARDVAPSSRGRNAFEAGVLLGPEVEPDQALDADGDVDRRVAALPAASRARALNGPPTDPGVEARLARIQDQLDELARVVADRPRDPAPDPMAQATALLERLREARRVEELVAQVPEISGVKAKPQANDAAPTEGTADEVVEGESEMEPRRPAPALLTRVYRPRYISVAALQNLVMPLLTAGVGRVAGSPGPFANEESAPATPAEWEALVVRDTPATLRKVDRLVQEVDVAPPEVRIEATVLAVRLAPEKTFGTDLSEFNGSGMAYSITAGEADASGGAKNQSHGTGLKSGIVRGDPRSLIGRLRGLPLTHATSSQATVVNRHTVEFLLGDVTGSAKMGAQNTLAGMTLQVQPFVMRGGGVRLDVRTESGSAAMSSSDPPASRSTGLTSQFTLRDGETAILCGPIEERLVSYTYRRPTESKGSARGNTVDEKVEVPDRIELIVLLTPHVRVPKSPAATARPKQPASRPGNDRRDPPAGRERPAPPATSSAREPLPAPGVARVAQPAIGSADRPTQTPSSPETSRSMPRGGFDLTPRVEADSSVELLPPPSGAALPGGPIVAPAGRDGG